MRQFFAFLNNEVICVCGRTRVPVDGISWRKTGVVKTIFFFIRIVRCYN